MTSLDSGELLYVKNIIRCTDNSTIGIERKDFINLVQLLVTYSGLNKKLYSKPEGFKYHLTQFENKEIFSLCSLYIEEGAEWICCAKIMAKVVLRTA